jgi:sugar phosphate isomerase/epimerase
VQKPSFSRRGFLGAAALSPFLLQGFGKPIPVGLELFSVRDQLKADLPGTLKTVAADGYQCVEFFAPYHNWTLEQAKEARKVLDDSGLRCFSTHNSIGYFEEAQIGHTIELNHTLGTRYAVVASAGSPKTLDGWKAIADKLSEAAERLKPEHLYTGYHNHQVEFTPLEGTRPIEVLARNTPKDVMLQFDVGTCVEVGSDPVAWIKANPGRIRSLHCKDWGPQQGYQVLFGEGTVPWKAVFAAAESVGGVEYYLIEQEGSRYPAFETAKICLQSFKKLRGQAT